ncbi:hypothetical protein BN1723_016762, partial [Verticillium longisporum]
VEAATIDR